MFDVYLVHLIIPVFVMAYSASMDVYAPVGIAVLMNEWYELETFKAVSILKLEGDT